jgi:hypothetical protein
MISGLASRQLMCVRSVPSIEMPSDAAEAEQVSQRSRRSRMQLKRALPMLWLLMMMFVPAAFARTPALLPFQVDLVEAAFPGAPALHSFAIGEADGKWLFIGGRTNGIHAFDPLPINNFPPAMANHWVWVLDPALRQAWSVDLYDPSITPPLGLIADALSSSNTQSFQDGDTLYIIGGYGYNRSTNLMQTFPTLTAINVPGMITAVMSGTAANIVSQIRQGPADDRLKVTGGELGKIGENFFLVFGQRFDGLYNPQDVDNDQQYTEEVRIFQILDDGTNPPTITGYTTLPVQPPVAGDPQPNQFHRRDLNVVPAIRPNGRPGINVYGGVFTTAFTPYLNPIYIDSVDGVNSATIDRSFNQYMSQYDTARMVLFDAVKGSLHTVFFGGISFGVFEPDSGASAKPQPDARLPYADLIRVEPKSDPSGFKLDPSIPFIDQITAINLRADGTSQQCVLAQRNQLKLTPIRLPERLGTNAHIIPAPEAPTYDNGVIKLRDLSDRSLVGYLYGGMRTRDENPTGTGQSFASNRIFYIYVTPIPTTCIAVPLVIE